MVHNHTIDHGRERLANIYRALRDAGIVPLGYGKANSKWLLFNTIPLPIENWLRTEGKPDICHASVKRLASAIRKYKASHPSARIVVQVDADAIVGHHPHVVQPHDTIASSPVLYSLGNFVFDQSHPNLRHSMIIILNFTIPKLHIQKIPIEIRQCKPEIHPKAPLYP